MIQGDLRTVLKQQALVFFTLVVTSFVSPIAVAHASDKIDDNGSACSKLLGGQKPSLYDRISGEITDSFLTTHLGVPKDFVLEIDFYREYIFKIARFQPHLKNLGLVLTDYFGATTLDEIRKKLTKDPVVTAFASVDTSGLVANTSIIETSGLRKIDATGQHILLTDFPGDVLHETFPEGLPKVSDLTSSGPIELDFSDEYTDEPPMTFASEVSSIFQTDSMRMSQLVYRESNLVKDETRSTYTLIESPSPFHSTYGFYGINNKIAGVLSARLQIIHALVGKRVNGKKFDYEEAIYQAFKPFHLEFGVQAVLKTIETVSRQIPVIELKRLFWNRDPDPFGVLNILPSQEVDMLTFHKAVITALPAGCAVQASAHSPAHIRLYKRYGFKIVEEQRDPRWPDHAVTLLEAPREELLSTVDRLIQRLSSH